MREYPSSQAATEGGNVMGSTGWNEELGRVSRAFDDWRGTDSEIRSWLRLTLEWSTAGYEKAWKSAEDKFQKIFDPDRHYGDEHVGYFDDNVGGLWPHTHAWMLLGAAVKDAVSAFEVYLEKALAEALASYRWQMKGGPRIALRTRSRPAQSPQWETLVRFHGLLGSEVSTSEVKEVRELRHLLTHQRGELRHAAQLERFKSYSEGRDDMLPSPFVGGNVALTEVGVEKAMGILANVVRRADPVIYNLLTGIDRLPSPHVLIVEKQVAELVPLE